MDNIRLNIHKTCWWVGFFLMAGAPVTLLTAENTGEKNGGITGTISSADPMIRILAVDRSDANVQKIAKGESDPFAYPGEILDAKTGTFRIEGLLANKPGGYDLILWTKSPKGKITRWEGVNMDYHRDITPSTPITPEDRTWLETFITQVPQFYDKCRILWMAADHQHATLLVELIRTRDFYKDKGDIVYRTELWYFENLFGGWAKDRNTEKVITRWRGNPEKLEKNWQWLPSLGNIPAGTPDLKITLPTADQKRGRLEK